MIKKFLAFGVVTLIIVSTAIGLFIELTNYRLLAAKPGSIALWVATCRGRLVVILGTSRTGSQWYSFEEQKFANGQWSGFFEAIHTGPDEISAGFGCNVQAASVFSKTFGFWQERFANGSTRVRNIQLPSWPIFFVGCFTAAIWYWKKLLHQEVLKFHSFVGWALPTIECRTPNPVVSFAGRARSTVAR